MAAIIYNLGRELEHFGHSVTYVFQLTCMHQRVFPTVCAAIGIVRRSTHRT